MDDPALKSSITSSIQFYHQFYHQVLSPALSPALKSPLDVKSIANIMLKIIKYFIMYVFNNQGYFVSFSNFRVSFARFWKVF